MRPTSAGPLPRESWHENQAAHRALDFGRPASASGCGAGINSSARDAWVGLGMAVWRSRTPCERARLSAGKRKSSEQARPADRPVGVQQHRWKTMTDRALAPTQKQATARAMTAASGILQRKCACGTHTMGSECEECKKKKGLLQRAPLSSCGRGTQGEGEVPPIVHEVLRSPGQPLDAETRAFFEPRFGQDFSQVRVHTDAKAADSSRAVNALAYTVGRDVVFEASQYAPGTIAGRIVLAHELTHVIQQDAMYGGSVRAIGLPGDRHEKEAEVTGIAIGAGIKRSLSIQGGRSPILRRVSFGTDGDLSPSRKAMVTKAAAIAE